MASPAPLNISQKSASRLRESATLAVRRAHPQETPSQQTRRVNQLVQNILTHICKDFEKEQSDDAWVGFAFDVQDLTDKQSGTTYMVQLDACTKAAKIQFGKNIALTTYDPQDSMEVSLPPATEEKKKAPDISNILTIQGTAFLLSPELLSGMRGERDPFHRIPSDILTAALRKKLSKIREQLSTPDLKQSTLDYYFKHDQRILNIVIKIFPAQEIPFVVHTAYYMLDLHLKERFHLETTTAYNAWINQLSQIGTQRPRQRSDKHSKED